MLEFVQSYGLWIALAGVFVAMHWFGMGCCGGRQGRRKGQSDGDATAGTPGSGKASQSAPRSGGGCH